MPDITPVQNRWLRSSAGVLAVALAGASAVAGQLWRSSTPRSPGVLAAAVLSGFAATALLALAAGPARWRRPLLIAWARIASRLRAGSTTADDGTGYGLAAIGAAGCALIVGRLLSLPQNPWDDDQGAFLITAQEIHRQGGLRGLWSSLWNGSFAEANRHPLYLALLSLRPTVRGGELLSATLGALTWLVLTAGTARKFGWRTAGMFGLLMGTNAAFCLFSTRIVCDVLLVLICGLAWLVHVRPVGAPDQPAVSRGRCAAAGGLLGLAWMTKGTGLVLCGAYLAWLTLAAWRQAPRSGASPENRDRATALRRIAGPVLIAIIAFVAVGSPLIARNVQRFGNPFHNLNSLLLFADRYDDLELMVERGLSTGAAAREYVQSHSLGEIVDREARGLVWEAFIFVRALGPAPLDDARILFGLPLAFVAVGGMAVRRQPADGLLLAWTAVSWLMFAWYVPIAAGERFLLPLLAPVLIAAADALVLLIGRGLPGGRWQWWGIALFWTTGWVVACWLSTGFVHRTG